VWLAFASQETDPENPFLFHKTTHRPLYRLAQQTARRTGLWDLIFRNLHGEITEGSISNIFAKIHGTWYTPPQECGLLAGVMREETIQRLSSEERTLSTGDLLRADELLVTNSVRGGLRAQLAEEAAIVMVP
jgi:para-aminobenzoate synthetase/4-amino-4-deoxychorismate lyase